FFFFFFFFKKKGLYAWDFYANLIFDLNLLNYPDLLWLFYLSICFLMIAWLSNLMSLSRYQSKWTRDFTVRERVYQWFLTWQRLLYACTALSGSAFGTVELANSFLFGFDFFCMGLTERHLKKFNQNRLFASVITQNLPQLVIQLYFLAHQHFQLDSITAFAFVSSLLSVGATALDFYSSKRLFAVLKDKNTGKYIDSSTILMHVKSREIYDNKKRLQISTYAFRDMLAEIVSIDPRAVEVQFPIVTPHGFKIKFSIFSSKVDGRLACALLQDSITKQEFGKKIRSVWRLSYAPEIEDLSLESTMITDNDDDGDDNNDGNANDNHKNSAAANDPHQNRNFLQSNIEMLTIDKGEGPLQAQTSFAKPEDTTK
ncbi:hypothetical protein RFI_02676, partial [Reticulomyxa filosa]